MQIILPDNTSVTRPAMFNNGRWLVTYPDTYLPGNLSLPPYSRRNSTAGITASLSTARNWTSMRSILDDVNWLKNANLFLDSSQLPVIAATDLPANTPAPPKPGPGDLGLLASCCYWPACW